MNISESDRSLARYLFEQGHLKRLPRSGWTLAGVACPESIADHTFRTALLAWMIAEMEGADSARAALIALFHDSAETRVGDLHRLGKRYVDSRDVESRVLDDQLSGLPQKMGESLRSLWNAASEESAEARIVQDADRLECLLQAREYSAQGHDVEEWITSSRAALTTAAARRIAEAALVVSPDSWWSAAEGEAASEEP